MVLDDNGNANTLLSNASICLPGLLPSPPARLFMRQAAHDGDGCPPSAQQVCTPGVCLNVGCSVSQQKPNSYNVETSGKAWSSIGNAWKKPEMVPMPPLKDLGHCSEDGSTVTLDKNEVNVTLKKFDNALVGRMFGRRIFDW